MPLYIYQNEETGEVKEILQSMSEEHVYFENGIQWKRVYTVPTASIDTKINPFSEKEFVEKTGTKRGTVGDMMDLSSELSQRRAESTGSEDPVKRKLFSEYEKKTGKKHLSDKAKVIENSKVKIEL
jgi:hypothetical protein